MKTYFVCINDAIVRVMADGYDLFIGIPYIKFYVGEKVILSVRKSNVDYIEYAPLFSSNEVVYKKEV